MKNFKVSSFFIFHFSFFILHSLFFILYSSFFILHSSFFILHSSFLLGIIVIFAKQQCPTAKTNLTSLEAASLSP